MSQTILILPNKELADEIYATPVIDLPPETEPVLLGIPVELADGRLAYAHPFNEITVDWLIAYTQDISGCEVLENVDKLPYPVKVDEEV